MISGGSAFITQLYIYQTKDKETLDKSCILIMTKKRKK
jgi:hypothetical protein